MTYDGLSPEELQAEIGIALPDKEVVSIIDVNADINVGIDAASPIDLSAGANLNVAAPIQAAAGANVLTSGSDAAATATHSADGGVFITQNMNHVTADATSLQDSGIDQSGDTSGTGTDTGGTGTGTDTGTGSDTGTGTDTGAGTTVDTSTAGLMDGSLLNVDVNVDLNADLAAPIAGAVAANANVAAPINAGVAANIGSVDSTANAVTIQDATITQTMTDVHATADSDQTSNIAQGSDGTTGATTGGATSGTGAASGTASGGGTGGTSAG